MMLLIDIGRDIFAKNDTNYLYKKNRNTERYIKGKAIIHFGTIESSGLY